VREIVSLSMGKDSSALAVYLRNKYPNRKFEFVFVDNGAELPEAYAYLPKLESVIGRITVIQSSFEDLLIRWGGYLPSAKARWCTRKTKIEPLSQYLGQDEVLMHVGLTADETKSNRGWKWPKNITTKYTFQEQGIVRSDIVRILELAGIGLPKFYQWRSRSGCYCCPFQKRIEWVELLERHPEMFWKAAGFENQKYTWIQGLPLAELAKRKDEIRKRHNLFLYREELRGKQIAFNF